MKVYLNRAFLEEYEDITQDEGGINKRLHGINITKTADGKTNIEPVYIYDLAWHTAGDFLIIEIARKLMPWLLIVLMKHWPFIARIEKINAGEEKIVND